MDEFERAATEVEKVVFDEKFTNAMTDVHVDAQAMDENPLNDEDAQEVIEMHDHQWTKNELFFKKMRLTGSLYIGGERKSLIHEEFDEAARVDLKYYPVKITGFAVQTILSDKGGDYSLQQRLLMSARVKMEDEEGIGGVSYYEGHIPVRPEMRLDYDALTPDKARAWLGAYYPDLKTDVDTCIFSTEDEGEATVNLKSLDFDFSDINKKDRKSIIKKLNVYVNDALQYDSPVPYNCEVSGELSVFNVRSDEYDKTERNSTIMMLAQELRFSVDDVDENLLIDLFGYVVRGKGEHPVVTQLPLSSLHAMASGRQFYERTLE